MTLLRRLALLLVLAIPAGAAFAQAPADPVPLADLLRRPAFRNVSLSPDGRHLAATVPVNGRYNLGIIDLATRTVKRITNLESSDVAQFQWLSKDWIFFATGDLAEASGNIVLKERVIARLDGEIQRRIDLPGFAVLSTETDKPDEILILANLRNRAFSDVYRLNLATGRHTIASFDSPGYVTRWVLDHAQVPRLATSRIDGKNTLWYRADEKSSWEKFGDGSSDPDGVTPVGFDYDNKTLYVSSSANRDKRAVFKWDFGKKALGELVAESADADVATLVFSREAKKAVGFRANGDRPATAWLDERFARWQALVDATLEGRVNVLSWAADNPERMLVFSYSDRDPGTYYLYDPVKPSMERVVDVAGWIKPERMAERRAVRYKARDGLEIPAYLTLPPGVPAKNLPVVVNVHGGPNVRGKTWGFDFEDQILASRGFAVLSPNFRGSTGLGKRLYRSGFRQWGLAMQDDLVDGLKWLVEQGIADPKRACLWGGSYGGYATLYGVARDPDLWRCGVAYVAVSDIGLLFDTPYSDTARSAYRFLDFEAKVRIGDPERDRAQFDRTSAVKNAAAIKAPLFLAYGSDDQRVPLVHGDKMRSALDEHGKRYEWVVYPGEGHGFNKDEHRADFYRRALDFLVQETKPR
jgi:dipeptidyl aminopeptidase/acylaminoacyl peptidase